MSSGNYKNLALQAGGVLGTAYVGVVQALSERGLLSKFERVAGASAGAIMGTLIALRFSAAEIEEIMVNLNLSEFTDPTSPINLVQNYGYYAGDVFYQWIQDIIARKLTKKATFEWRETCAVNHAHIHRRSLITDLVSQDVSRFIHHRKEKAHLDLEFIHVLFLGRKNLGNLRVLTSRFSLLIVKVKALIIFLPKKFCIIELG